MRPIVAFSVVVVAIAGNPKHSLFAPNCAAKKECNRPLEERDPKLHDVPAGAPKGHLKPLGHPDFLDSWAGALDEVTDMSPETFWTKYHPTKPFVLKGFGKRSAAFEKWRDDEYILENFGHFKAKCEPRNEDRLTDYCQQRKMGTFIKCGKDTTPYVETHMKINKFVPNMRDMAFDKYIITQMPDTMAKDFMVPNFHNCGRRHSADRPAGKEWMTQMYENNFWLSHNGGNNFSTSVIHYDMNHQIMCQFEGTKEWIMWDMKENVDKIPMWSGYYDKDRHQAQGSDDSPIDGERVDLLRWPQFANAKWMNTTLQPGDCLFTPALVLHYVRSRGRNVAGMTMFQREERYDPTCNGASVPEEPKTLSDYDVLWSFPEEDPKLFGWNVIKMGYPNWKRQFIWRLATMAKKGQLTAKTFGQVFGQAFKKKADRQRVVDVFKSLSPDKDGKVTDAKILFESKELRFLCKDASVEDEGGRGEQEEDVEMERYSLVGDGKLANSEL